MANGLPFRTIPPTPLPELLDRGVYQMPWLSADGEVVLVAVTGEHRFFRYASVPHGTNRTTAIAGLQVELDRVDPIRMLNVV